MANIQEKFVQTCIKGNIMLAITILGNNPTVSENLDLDHLFHQVIQQERYTMLMWLLHIFDHVKIDVQDILARLCKNGYLKLGEHLVGCKNITDFSKAFVIACEYGHLYMVEWLDNMSKYVHDQKTLELAFEAACNGNHVYIVAYLHQKYVIDMDCRDCDHVFVQVCEKSCYDVAIWMLDNITLKPNDVRIAFTRACVQGHFRIVKAILFMYDNFDIRANNDMAFRCAGRRGHLDIVQYLFEKCPSIDIHVDNDHVLRRATTYNHQHIINWLATYSPKTYVYSDEAFIQSCKNGNLTACQKLDAMCHYNECKDDRNVTAFKVASGHNQLHVMRWLVGEHGVNVSLESQYALCITSRLGYTACVRWLIKQVRNVDMSIVKDLLVEACLMNDIELAETIIYGYPDLDISDDNFVYFRTACENDSLNVAIYLAESYPHTNVYALDGYAFKKACKNGHIKTLHWMTLNYETPISHINEVFMRFCYEKNTKMLLWVINQSGLLDIDGYSTVVFVSVCHAGYLEMAKILYHTYPEMDAVGDTNVIMAVCGFGHLDVLKWLMATFKFDIHDKNDSAFLCAINSNHIHIAKWIVHNYRNTKIRTQDDNALYTACANGYLDILQWLLCICPEFSDLDHMHASFMIACKYGRLNIAQYIYETYPASFKKGFGTQSFCIAFTNKHMDIIHWLIDITQSMTMIYYVKLEDKYHIVSFKPLLVEFGPEWNMMSVGGYAVYSTDFADKKTIKDYLVQKHQLRKKTFCKKFKQKKSRK